MMSIHLMLGFLAFGSEQVQSTESSVEATAMLSVSRVGPHTDPPVSANWVKIGPAHRCTGQDFRNQKAASQYDCEQIAISAKLPFYQYHSKKGLCATCEDGVSLTDNSNWQVYRNPALWSLKSMGQQCTRKKKRRQPAASSQIECQFAADVLGHPYYQWNANKNLCSTAKKCKDEPAPSNVGTYYKGLVLDHPVKSIDLWKELLLASFKNGGRGVVPSVNSTHPDLQAGAGSMTLVVLKTMGLDDVMWREAVDKSLEKHGDIEHFVDFAAANVKQNKDLVKVSAAMFDFFQPTATLNEEFKYELRFAVNYAFVLNSLTDALFHEQKHGPMWKAWIPTFEAAIAREDLFKGCPSACEYMDLFTYMKTVSVLDVMNKFFSPKKLGAQIAPNHGAADLFLNIEEAVFADLLYNNTDNARVGHELAMEPIGMPPIEGLGNGFSFEYQSLGVIDQRSAFPLDWSNLYTTWNMAFVTEYPAWPMFFAKLLVPIVTQYVEPGKEGVYLWPRAIALSLHIQYLSIARRVAGTDKNSDNTANKEPLLQLVADGSMVFNRDFSDWRNKDMTELWGSINAGIAQEYGNKVKHTIEEVGGAVVQTHLHRQAQGEGVFMSLQQAARDTLAGVSSDPVGFMQRLVSAFYVIFK